MEKLKMQAAKLWQLLTASETYGVYQTAIATTWTILKETGLLLWLVICLVLVFGEWFWKTAIGAGRSFRNWFNSLEGSSDQIASETGKVLLTAGKSSLSSTLALAKTQLGFAVEPEPAIVQPDPVVAKVAAPVTPVAAAAKPAAATAAPAAATTEEDA